MELFQGNGQLDEDVEDILYELGNVGVGMGAEGESGTAAHLGGR